MEIKCPLLPPLLSFVLVEGLLYLAGNPDSDYAVMVKYQYVSIGYHVHRSKCTVITDSESGDIAIQYKLTTVLAYLCKSQTRS